MIFILDKYKDKQKTPPLKGGVWVILVRY